MIFFRISDAKHRRSTSEAGFTLVELLIVITILGVLAAIVVFAVGGIGDKGKSVAVGTDAKVLSTAEEAYCAQHGHYTDIGTLHSVGLLASADDSYNSVVLGDQGTCGTGSNSSFAVVGSSDVIHTVGKATKISGHPTDIAVDSARGEVWVLNPGNSTVSMINTKTNKVTTIDITPTTPIEDRSINDRLVIDAKAGLVYVTVLGLADVVVIDEATVTLLGTLTQPKDPYDGELLVPGANSPVVVDPVTGDAYAWAQNASTSRLYLLRYAPPSTGHSAARTVPAVIDVSAGLPDGRLYQFGSPPTAENPPTVVDPGRALYQVGVIDGITYWLAVNLVSDAVTLTPFTDVGGRDLADAYVVGAFETVNSDHSVSATFLYPGGAGIATLRNDTISYPLLNDTSDPTTGFINSGVSWYLDVGVPATADPFTHGLLLFGQPDDGSNDSDADPQDQITLLNSTFHRVGTTGDSLGIAQQPSQFGSADGSFAGASGIMQKTLVVDPNTDRAYYAPDLVDQRGTVGRGGITSFDVGNPIPTSVNTGTKYAALAVDTKTDVVYATDFVHGKVVTVK